MNAVVLVLGIAAAAASAAPQVFAPGLVSTGHDDAHVAFTPDGETMYFIRNTPDFNHWTVLTAKRSGAGWSDAVVAPFSGRWSDADVFVTSDNKRLFFISTRPVDGSAKSDTDIWTMERKGEGWETPVHVPELASPGYEWFPTMTDAGVLYLGSERDGGAGKSDLWRARWLGDHFSAPENLGPLINTPDQEIEPLIAPDESFLIFAARGRKQNAGAYDIYVTWQCDGTWTEPQPLPAGVNSEGWDFGPRFSPDRKSFYFTSNRSTFADGRAEPLTFAEYEALLNAPGNGLRDVYRIDTAALGLQSPCSGN